MRRLPRSDAAGPEPRPRLVRRVLSSLWLRGLGLTLMAGTLSQCADRCGVFDKGYPLCGL